MTTDLFTTSDNPDVTPTGGIEGASRVSPPSSLLLLLAFELIVSAGLFLWSSRAAHLVGYVIAAVLVAFTAMGYRTLDRKRRRSSRYVGYGSLGPLVSAGLVVGVFLAAAHAYYFSLTDQLA